MYNLMFGKNPNSEVVLALLGLKENDIERYRNAWMTNEGITIHTRTGGGNREDYPNETITSHPCYLSDEDEEDDSTYANYFFKFPEEIKDDCALFLDVEKNGIPASIIKKVIETLNRPENKNDKWTRIYNEQKKVYSDLRWNLQVYETNGHTIVPLSDEAMGRLLEVAEKNDIEGQEGEFIPYSIKPYKLTYYTETPRWSFKSDEDNLCRIKIDLGSKWEVDHFIWGRYKAKFSEKYPKAIKAIEKRL